jgi:hypothetical protein
MARCPGHDDRTPSLSVRQGYEGVLVKCFAGCGLDKILGVLGLCTRDLFDETRFAARFRAVDRHRGNDDRDRRDRTDSAEQHRDAGRVQGDRQRGSSLRIEELGAPTPAQIAALQKARRITAGDTLHRVGARLVRSLGAEWIGLPSLAGGWKLWAFDATGQPRRDAARGLERRNIGNVSLFVSPDRREIAGSSSACTTWKVRATR